MADKRVREQIARLAAQLMYERLETEYFTAKRKAARQVGLDSRYHPKDLPSNREIRDHIQILACMYEGDARFGNLQFMRLEALRLMRKLSRFHPALLGSVLTGHIRKGSDIDIHVFSDQIAALTLVLDDLGLHYAVEHKRIIKHNEERVFTHIHVQDRFNYELTVYPESKLGYVFKSSITGKAIERATLRELEQFLHAEYPELNLDAETESLEEQIDCYDLFRLLLQPLENVKQNPRYHPEGDALYHSLQVFELAREARPWDEEFLLAALLHDVGKAIDPADHVNAALQALEGALTPRTEFFIAHHMDAHLLRAGTLGHRAACRLRAAEDADELLLLRDLDDQGRRCGALVCTLDEALVYLRRLAQESAGTEQPQGNPKLEILTAARPPAPS
ncbi:MAG: tRNA adenylyltransferase [Planctomycetota bacterium]